MYGQWWRFYTTTLLHANLLHLLVRSCLPTSACVAALVQSWVAVQTLALSTSAFHLIWCPCCCLSKTHGSPQFACCSLRLLSPVAMLRLQSIPWLSSVCAASATHVCSSVPDLVQLVLSVSPLGLAHNCISAYNSIYNSISARLPLKLSPRRCTSATITHR